mgnify:CR=1 FL=1
MFLISFFALVRGKIGIQFLYIGIGVLLYISLPVRIGEGIDASYYSELWRSYFSMGWDDFRILLLGYTNLEKSGLKDIGFHIYAYSLSQLNIGYNVGMALWVLLMAKLIFDMALSYGLKFNLISFYWALVVIGPHLFNGFRFWSATIFLLYPIITGKRQWLILLAPLFHIFFWVIAPILILVKKTSNSNWHYIILLISAVFFTSGLFDTSFLGALDNQISRFADITNRLSVIENLRESSGIGLVFWIILRACIIILALSLFNSKRTIDRIFVFLVVFAISTMFIESLGNRILRVAVIVSFFTSLSYTGKRSLYLASGLFYFIHLTAVYSRVDFLTFLL